jgi:hypothetical protein
MWNSIHLMTDLQATELNKDMRLCSFDTENMYKKHLKNKGKGKVKISLLQAVEAHRVARGQGSHIT